MRCAELSRPIHFLRDALPMRMAVLAMVVCVQSGLAGEVQVIAPDGAWTWFNDPRAVLRGDVLCAGYVRRDGRVCATTCDLKTKRKTEVELSSWTERDDHDNPAFVRLADGRLAAFYAAHGSKKFWNYRVARNPTPRAADDWGPERSVDLSQQSLRGGVTYNNPFLLPRETNRLYNFMRGIQWNPTLQTSEDGGDTWNSPIHLIRSPDRPYVKYASNGRDRIDLAFTDGHPRTTDNSVHHVYLENGVLHRTDGTPLGRLGELTPIEPSAATTVYGFGSAYPKGRAWVWDIAYEEPGAPVIAHTVKAATNDIRYFYATWDVAGRKWHSREIAGAGLFLYRSEQDYVGGITLDPVIRGVVYLSTPVDPRSGRPTPHREIYRGQTNDRGKSWSWEAVTQNSDRDNLRPYVPREHTMKICLLWFRGTYRAYTDYECEVVGLFE